MHCSPNPAPVVSACAVAHLLCVQVFQARKAAPSRGCMLSLSARLRWSLCPAPRGCRSRASRAMRPHHLRCRRCHRCPRHRRRPWLSPSYQPRREAQALREKTASTQGRATRVQRAAHPAELRKMNRRSRRAPAAGCSASVSTRTPRAVVAGLRQPCQPHQTGATAANRTVDGVVERLGGVVVGKERKEVHCAAAVHSVNAVDEDLRGVELRKRQRQVSQQTSATSKAVTIRRAVP